MTLHKVFVYGTLKTGEPNSHLLTQATGGHKKLICSAKTTIKYPLIIGTKYNIPFLLYEPGTGENVEGELYEIDDEVLAALDKLENHPNFYIREQNEIVSTEDDGTVHIAWLYFIKNFNKNLLNKEMMKSYTNNASYPKYVERYHRNEEAELDDLNAKME